MSEDNVPFKITLTSNTNSRRLWTLAPTIKKKSKESQAASKGTANSKRIRRKTNQNKKKKIYKKKINNTRKK